MRVDRTTEAGVSPGVSRAAVVLDPSQPEVDVETGVAAERAPKTNAVGDLQAAPHGRTSGGRG